MKLLKGVLGRGWGCPSRLSALAVDHGSWVCGRNGGKGEKALIKEILRRRDQQELRGLGGKGSAPFTALELVVSDSRSSGNRPPSLCLSHDITSSELFNREFVGIRGSLKPEYAE